MKVNEPMRELALWIGFYGMYFLAFLSIVTGVFVVLTVIDELIKEKTVRAVNLVALSLYIGALYVFVTYPLTKLIVYEEIVNGVSSGVMEYTTITDHACVGLLLLGLMSFIVGIKTFFLDSHCYRDSDL